jgi:hypothetical protein
MTTDLQHYRDPFSLPPNQGEWNPATTGWENLLLVMVNLKTV